MIHTFFKSFTCSLTGDCWIIHIRWVSLIGNSQWSDKIARSWIHIHLLYNPVSSGFKNGPKNCPSLADIYWYLLVPKYLPLAAHDFVLLQCMDRYGQQGISYGHCKQLMSVITCTRDRASPFEPLKPCRPFSKLAKFSSNCHLANNWTSFVEHKL